MTETASARASEPCDRCVIKTPAVRVVTCCYGCNHAQCEPHARQTEQERADEARWVTRYEKGSQREVTDAR